MPSWQDNFNRLTGQSRYVVCRLFVHLAGNDVATFLGVLNSAARQAIAAEGDLQIMGESLVDICQSLLQNDLYWQSAANEGDVFWQEGAAAEYVDNLFTDSAQRYNSGVMLGDVNDPDDILSIPITQNVVVMITVAYTGEVPDLETDLANVSALKEGLKAIIDLHYGGRLQAIQVHFSPAQLGDALTSDQLLVNFPELVPL